jgi:hypothetical protein
MEPIDIWRSARLIVGQKGEHAAQDCRRRSASFASIGDTDGAAVWEAIGRAAQELLDNGPPDDVRLN